MKDTNCKQQYTLKLVVFAGLLVLNYIYLPFLGALSYEWGRISQSNSIKTFWSFISKLRSCRACDFSNQTPSYPYAALVGAGLAITGGALQGLFQNSLVSPDILGVSSGAGFGAALGILLTSGIGYITIGLSFAFGLLSVMLTLSLVKAKGRSQTISYILAGIIVSSVFSALTSLIKYVADVNDQLPTITFWLMGSFANTVFYEVQLVLLPILVGVTGLIFLRWRINILSLGDEEAFSLGINPQKIRIAVILFSTVITAASVMVSGIIGWVGLVIPHICRYIIGVNHDRLLSASCLLGASFMVVVDCAARNITAAEIPIGILTALVGAPFFALIYSRMKGES